MKHSIKYLVFTFILASYLLAGCGNGNGYIPESSASDSLAQAYLNTAIKTANWLVASAIKTPNGITWRSNPEDTSSVYYSLYYGSPGIIIYFLELYHVTKDASYLRVAERASSDLLAIVSNRESDFFTRDKTGFTGPENRRSGLYSGLGGIGFVFGEMYLTTGDKKYQDGMMECVKALKDSVKIKGNTASWSTTEDLLCGDAGTGLFLLYAYQCTKDSSLKTLAEQTGNFLIKSGIPDKGGLKWPMEPSFPRLMPNFAHGTSGVSYFLIRLYRETDHLDYLYAGFKGANYLLQCTDTATGFVFHHEGDGRYKGKCGGPGCVKTDTCIGNKLYYLSWCHGPAGTSRLYRLLSGTSTEYAGWYSRMEFAALSVLKSGIPDQLTEGYWNNLGQCCGAAGVGEYSLSLYRSTRETRHLLFAKHLADFILKNSVEESGALKFPHAENNRERNVVYAQTGYMTGAAGIGMFFLHMHEQEKGIETSIKFPDNSF